MASAIPPVAAAARAVPPPLASIRDLPAALRAVQAGRDGRAFARIYRVTNGEARCGLPAELAAKYSLGAPENVQRVISVTNRYTHDQAWWNPARSSKPQTFVSRATAADLDTTGGGARCDFCAWRSLTARDAGFGRAHLRHAVTGSNLFKYAEPAHGVVLFRHHDPLAFGADEVSDLLNTAWLWFEGAQAQHAQRGGGEDGGGGGGGGGNGGAARLEPFFLWNCLPRAGASQFHGHAQVAAAAAAVPQQTLLRRAAADYAADGAAAAAAAATAAGETGSAVTPCDAGSDGGGGASIDGGPCMGSLQALSSASGGNSGDDSGGGGGGGAAELGSGGGELGGACCLYADLLRAHRAVGLLRQVTVAAAALGGGGGGGGASLSSSSSLSSTASSSGGGGGALDRGWGGAAWVFPSLAPHKDCEMFVVGSHLGCPALHAAVAAALRALVDGLGVGTFNAAALNVDTAAPHPLAGPLARASAAWARAHGDDDSGGGGGEGAEAETEAADAGLRAPLRRARALPVAELWVPDAFPPARPPVVVRLVSRGKLDSPASDFGGLEVFGGASIGHTDPWRVADALDARLAALGGAA